MCVCRVFLGVVFLGVVSGNLKPRKKISEQSKTDEAIDCSEIFFLGFIVFLIFRISSSKTDEAKNSTKGGKTKIETLKKRGKHTYAINPGSSTNKCFFFFFL